MPCAIRQWREVAYRQGAPVVIDANPVDKDGVRYWLVWSGNLGHPPFLLAEPDCPEYIELERRDGRPIQAPGQDKLNRKFSFIL